MVSAKIKESYFYQLIFYFLIYSFMGWFWETTVVFIMNGYLTKRGFIFGPFCIIYGFGMLLLITLLKPLKHKPFLFFLCTIALISILEYITGFALEAVFNRRWWDYTLFPFNLNGYICLRASILWGILATIISRYFHPKLEVLVKKISCTKASSLAKIMPVFLITNIVISILYNL